MPPGSDAADGHGRALASLGRVSTTPSAREPRTVLLTLTGEDRPGVTSTLFDALAAIGTEVLDVEQVVVRGQLTLAVLLAADEGSGALVAAAEDVGARLGMDVRFSGGRGDNAHRRTGRAAVVVIGAPLEAAAVAALARSIAVHGANIDRIRRLARYPVTTIEFDVSGADVAGSAPRARPRGRRPGRRHRRRAGRPGTARSPPRRHGRRLHAHPGRGHRAPRRPRRAGAGGRRRHGGRDARRARLRREPEGPGGHARRAARRGLRRRPGGRPAHPGREDPRPHPPAAGLQRGPRLGRVPRGRRAARRRAGDRPRRRQPARGRRRRAHGSDRRRHRRPGRQGGGAAPVRRGRGAAAQPDGRRRRRRQRHRHAPGARASGWPSTPSRSSGSRPTRR